jgi:hypothetical protein
VRYLEVSIRLPDDLLHPIQAFIRQEDAVRYEDLRAWTVLPDGDVEFALYYVEADLDRYRAAVDDVDTVLEYRLEPVDDGAAHVWARERTRPETTAWRDAFAERQLVVVPPVRFDEDAAMDMTIVGDPEAARQLLDDLPGSVDVTVQEVGTYDHRGGVLGAALTDRQRDAVVTAMAAGYYDVPRSGSLADVADALGCAESTASELLRRAERTVFSRVLERYGGDAESVAHDGAVPDSFGPGRNS